MSNFDKAVIQYCKDTGRTVDSVLQNLDRYIQEIQEYMG